MTVNIQTVHFDADSKLLEHVNKKIAKLENHHDRIMKVDVFLKLDNVMHQIKDKVSTSSQPFVVAFQAERALHYAGLSTFATFGRGWMRRLIRGSMEAAR